MQTHHGLRSLVDIDENAGRGREIEFSDAVNVNEAICLIC